MKIVFNGMNVGFGNGGGTKTNFTLANELSRMGHDVEVWSSGPN